VSAKSILLVEDNPDHQVLTQRALKKADVLHAVITVADGDEALDYLFGQGGWSERDLSVQPALVLLDLKLIRMDGLEVLRRIRGDARTKLIPVAILTSSREESDVRRSYETGANSYVRKSVNFDEFAETLKTVAAYWLEVNEAPPLGRA